MKTEHPRCRHCKTTFLLSYLYKEHLQKNKACKLRSNLNLEEVKIKEQESETLKDSGLESLSDSTEEPVKVTVTQNYLGQFEVKSKETKKRKADGNETSYSASKKQKTVNHLNILLGDTDEDQNTNNLSKCKNTGCPHHGNHRCQYPPVLRLGDYIRTSGTILRELSLVDGVPKFVPFNNSLLETLGCQFYFKNKGGAVEITSYSAGGEAYEYQLTLSSKNTHKTSPMRARIGEKRRVAAFDLDSSCVRYELVVNSKL